MPVKKRRWRRSDRNLPKRTPLPGTWSLLKTTLKAIASHRNDFFYLTIIFFGLYVLLSQAINATSVASAIDSIKDGLGINPDSLGGRFVVAGSILQLSGNLDGATTGYMLFATLIFSLSIIWILRHHWAQKPTNAKEALYKSPYALVPLIILTIFALIQLLPFSIGSALTDIAFTRGIVVGVLEKTATFVLLVILPMVFTASQIIKTLMAMVIVTVPDMGPVAAYRSAKMLLKKRRLAVFRRLLGIGLIYFLLACVLLVILIATVPALTILGVIVINSVGLLFFVSFLYVLYRQML